MTTTTKYYTADQIRTQFEKMPESLKIKVLYEAIDIMQQYNVRSRFLCIAMAMGMRTLRANQILMKCGSKIHSRMRYQ